MTKYPSLFLIILSQFFTMSHASVSEADTRWKSSLDQILVKPKPLKRVAGNESVVTLFTIHGSNTIGGSLAPTMLMSYLKAKGIDNIRIQPLLAENEKRYSK